MAQIDWNTGRGKLGVFAPLLGSWSASADTDLGPVICHRRFSFILDRKFVQLDAEWTIGADKQYDERCVFGPGPDKQLCFWSFTSDGKRSNGWLSQAPEIHPKALCFEADMDAGRARQVYWPHERPGFNWAVESKTKKGWNRFVMHHYEAE